MAIRYEYGVCACGRPFAYQVDEDDVPLFGPRKQCYGCEPHIVTAKTLEAQQIKVLRRRQGQMKRWDDGTNQQTTGVRG